MSGGYFTTDSLLVTEQIADLDEDLLAIIDKAVGRGSRSAGI